jgi:KDO2-lipid IV(A) lauroyltransferase
MARPRNPLVQALTTAATLAFIRCSGWIPLGISRPLAIRMGRLLTRFVPRVRRVTRENLERAYGDTLSAAEKARICQGAIDNVSIVAAEFGHIPKMGQGSLGASIEVEGFDQLVPGQGYLCIGAHLGNWELAGPVMALRDLKIAEVVRPFDDPRMDRAIDGIRRSQKVHTIPKDNAGKEIIQRLKAGWLVGVLIDQSPRDSAVPVTFFDAPCWATIAPVMIAVRAKVPVLPISLTRRPDFGYTLRFHAPIEMVRSGNLRDDLVVNSQRCQDAIEALIRANPEQWLWLHRRWKARPRLEEAWARKEARESRKAGDGATKEDDV